MAGQDESDQEIPGPSRKRRRQTREPSNDDFLESSDISHSSSSTENSSRSGFLEWITVKNFMCHDHLHFKFSSEINFVQGRNGSGKSAILTAVVVGLGGMARSTNRGNSLKDLVKQGKQNATIEIGINNCGRAAYKYDLYGRNIIVERKISVASTGAGYKLKSASGSVISIKKDDLVRILEHFNLQVDNPITVLNQDMSRSFFSITDPKLLFKLFLKATQLQQMKDDYAHLENTIESSMKIIESRKECMADMEKEVEDQRIHYQFSLSLREKGIKLKEMRRELAWARIIQNEKLKADAEKALEEHQKEIVEIKEKMETLQSRVNQENESRESRARELEQATKALTDASKEVGNVDKDMRDTKNKYKDKQSQFLITEKKVRSITMEISTLKAAIEKDHSRAQSEWAAARAQWQRKIDKVEGEMMETIKSMETVNTHMQNLQNTLEVNIADKKQLDVEEKMIRREMNDLQRELKGLQNQKGSQLTVYGQWVPQLLQKIENAHSRGMFAKKPVGPMGAYIKVKDTQWAHVAEQVLARRISSFIVDNQRDEKVLGNLMKDIRFNQQSKPIVIVARFREKVFDVAKFEVVCPGYQSLWSILDISSTVVANTIIDLMQVESILLIPTAQEAGNLLKDKSTVPKNVNFAYTLNLDQYYPDPNYRVYSGKGFHRAKFLQVSVEDKIREVSINVDNCKRRLDSMTKQIQEAQVEERGIKEQITACNRKHQQFKKKLETQRMTLADVQNQETPSPPDISQLEDDIKQQQVSLADAKAKMQSMKDSVEVLKSKFEDASGLLLELRQKEKDAKKKVQDCKREADSSNVDVMTRRIAAFVKKEKELLKEEESLAHTLHEKTEALNEALKSTEEYNLAPRIDTKRNVKELERMYSSLSARLNRERASSGDPVTIAEKFRSTKQRYKQVSDDISKHVNLMTKLKESLIIRETKQLRLTKWLAVILKYFFKEHLSMHKLNGSIAIDPVKKTLEIFVEKRGDIITNTPTKSKATPKKKGAHQDLVMMSGGERSFSTVAFIIALWHVIVSPVRILDEFDVFMDVIARNRAMKMMISAAKSDTQYIYLTPLSLDTDKFSNCSFFRMPDPERDEKL